ncbi:transmembrane protein 39A [Bacillus rossius redtenbacheri]|uniref:transmembrane protein 39A n=1 Tax=Bacillus rossius redtenbacheri TaxID=93214 RepID=UPI002FDEFBF5
MAGGRRNINRASSGRSPLPPPPVLLVDDASKGRLGGQAGAEGLSARALTVKHIPVPVIPQDGGVTFEVLMFVFTVMSSCLQFLHLYRTVWWLPQSFTRYAMNFYLIDPYLVGFIGTILSRRLLYCMLCRVLAAWSPAHAWPLLQQLLQLMMLCAVSACLVWCAYHIIQNHPLMNIFFLCYPIFVYFILFGLHVSPFFDVNSLPSASKKDQKDRPYYGKPLHNCSSSPHAIRDEVEGLKTDFNNRMKQILFSSVLNAYYAGFVPCCFAQAYLYYDVYWATQHLVFVWLGCFFMYLVHCCPVRYCDVLHRAALHLGRWGRVEGRNSHIPSHIWAESTLWHQGALVKHCKELYKAEGVCNAAEPGNQTHNRFYAVFSNPTNLVLSLVSLQGLVVLVQLCVLVACSEWYHVVSLGLLLFASYYTLFKLARDYLVCWRLYGVERAVQQRSAE